MQIQPKDLINLFIVAEGDHGLDARRNIPYIEIDNLAQATRELWDLGVPACKLFVFIKQKSHDASAGLDPDSLLIRAIKTVKDAVPEMIVMSEVCACAYSSNGECILLFDNENGIDDQATHEYVGEMAQLHAGAGCDVVVAGLTHDGSIRAMRQALDDCGYSKVEVMASIQFRSAFYAPYRNMMNTEPEAGETFRSHIEQSDSDRAIQLLDQFENEGAALFTVQPAMPTMDHLARITKHTNKPVSAYSVSAELPCFTGTDRHLLPERAIITNEYFNALLRLGASTVMTYIAEDFSRWLNQ